MGLLQVLTVGGNRTLSGRPRQRRPGVPTEGGGPKRFLTLRVERLTEAREAAGSPTLATCLTR